MFARPSRPHKIMFSTKPRFSLLPRVCVCVWLGRPENIRSEWCRALPLHESHKEWRESFPLIQTHTLPIVCTRTTIHTNCKWHLYQFKSQFQLWIHAIFGKRARAVAPAAHLPHKCGGCHTIQVSHKWRWHGKVVKDWASTWCDIFVTFCTRKRGMYVWNPELH